MKPIIILSALVALVLMTSVALAQGSYQLSWWTVDGGGYTSSQGGAYALGGAAGQPDAGRLKGGSYILTGGFWNGDVSESQILYLPIIVKSG